MNENRAILLLSGGIDSTTLLASLRSKRIEVTAMIFDYGQSLWKEVEIAESNAKAFGADPLVLEWDTSYLPPTCSLLRGGPPISKGRSLEEIAKGTPTSYVPFRNGVFLAYAVAYGEAAGIEAIYCGGNGLASGNYWDDTASFAAAFEAAAVEGTSPGYMPKVLMPWAKMTKRQVVRIGRELGVDYGQTWSCYLNGPAHCGQCDSCIQRAEALKP